MNSIRMYLTIFCNHLPKQYRYWRYTSASCPRAAWDALRDAHHDGLMTVALSQRTPDEFEG